MFDYTPFYCIKFDECFKDQLSEVTEHLAMNGYTYESDGNKLLFVYDEEIDYVLTILDDKNIEYVVL